MATARGLLEALSEGNEETAWAWAQELAQLVLIGEEVVLAKLVLDGGPYAMRKAEELAEAIIAEVDGTAATAPSKKESEALSPV